MSQHDPTDRTLRQLGQTQAGRLAPELASGFAQVDTREAADLARALAQLAEHVRYHRLDGTTTTWAPFFPWTEGDLDALIRSNPGTIRPDIALILAFFELYKVPQAIINTFADRHLDFYYREVLRLSERPARPDLAHVVVELKRGAGPTRIGPEHALTAGKDATGIEQIYAPTRETVCNAAQIASLRSVYLDARARGVVRQAPVAASSDGLGGALSAADPSWPGFGRAELPAAEIGFALASPTLRLAAGRRTVTVTLQLAGAGALTADALASSFACRLTGPAGWIEIPSITCALVDGRWDLSFTLEADAPAVVDYKPALHGLTLTATGPVLQVVLRTDGARLGYADLSGLIVRSAQVRVDVRDLTPDRLSNDHGVLDPKRAFLPFGTAPARGEPLRIGCAELLSKRATEVQIRLAWKGAPPSLALHYLGYNDLPTNASFTVNVAFTCADWTCQEQGKAIFDPIDATKPQTILLRKDKPTAPGEVLDQHRLGALAQTGTRWAGDLVQRELLRKPSLAALLKSSPESDPGFIVLELQRTFLHEQFRGVFTRTALELAKGSTLFGSALQNEPYTPLLQELKLSYKAETNVVRIDSNSLDDFAHPDVQLFHLDGFGQRREHAFQRAQLGFLRAQADVPLLPSHPDTGALLIGLSGTGGGESVSLLFQVAEGSADPRLERADLRWSVLSDNYWYTLQTRDIQIDTTGGLLRSGIVRLAIPSAATTHHTLLPSGLVWLRAGLPGDVAAVCRLIEILPNAVEVRFRDQGNDPARFATPLPAGSIAKFKAGVAGVKAVRQPYASFAGAPSEQPAHFRARTSERLRHKARCVTPWDYERIVLEAAPHIHRVQCVPHAAPGRFQAPGHVLLVLVPDLRNQNALDRLAPRVDAGTLRQVQELVMARAGMGLQVHVTNPVFQRVRLDFKVAFRAGFDASFQRGELERAVTAALTPWTGDGAEDPTRDSRVHRSALLDLIEDLPYVDFVTDFKMYSFLDGDPNRIDVPSTEPSRPDAVLASDYGHDILVIG